MVEDSETKTEILPPHAQLIQMVNAFWVSRLIYVAAKLELADHLAEGPKSAAELASPTGTHSSSLHRLMRTLASLGVLSEGTDRRFSLTLLGEALKTGAPGAARSTIMFMASNWSWRAWEAFPDCLEDGGVGMEKAWGMPIFDFFATHPQEASYFNETMIGFHGSEPPAVAAAFDFSGFRTVVDVGGGTGNMLTTILARHGEPQGVLFDLPHVVGEAAALIEARGLADRINIESGNFFESVPGGGDAYLLSHIIHDWSEDQCLTILGNCRKAMKPSSRLLIIEMVLPAGNAPHPGKLLDMAMLVYTGGQERTEQEYATLLGKAGFRLRRVVPTESPVSVVEAERA